MRAFATIHAALDRLSRVAVWIGGTALLLSAIMVTIDVFSRKLFSVTMSGADEISGYVFAASTTWAYSYCIIHRANIRIDAFYNFLPMWLRAILDVLGIALLLLFMAMLTRYSVDVFLTSWVQNSMSVTTLSIPLWIPQLAWVAGLVMFIITATFMLIYVLVALLQGDIQTVQSVAGTLSIEEEIGEETRGMDLQKSKDGEQ